VLPIAAPINTFLSISFVITWCHGLFSENNMALKKQADIMKMPRPNASCR
jgi:hypothetical protein